MTELRDKLGRGGATGLRYGRRRGRTGDTARKYEERTIELGGETTFFLKQDAPLMGFKGKSVVSKEKRCVVSGIAGTMIVYSDVND